MATTFDFKTAVPVTSGVISSNFIFGAGSQSDSTPSIYTVAAMVGSSTVTFTNKTFDTAGTGNSFSINGLAATANTGTGAVARATSPTFVTPTLGVAAAASIQLGTASSVTGALILANASSGFLTTIQGGNAAAARTYTWPTNFGAAGSVLTDSAGNGTLSWTSPGAGSITVGSTTVVSGTTTRILYDNAGTLGEYTITGTGTVVAMQTSPSLVTPTLGVASATSINKVAITAPATSATLTIADGKTLTANASLTLAGTDSTTMTFPSTSTTVAGLSIANVFSSAVQTVSALTTTSPGWYAQITGDANARMRVGLNATDVASLAFGDGTAVRDTFIERLSAANLRFGAPDAAAPVAQTLSVQNVVAGTSDTAGATLTINGSRSTGTGAAGTIAFQTASAAASTASTQNALATVLTIGASSNLGSSQTTALTLAPTWNTSGTPTALKVNVANTASNAASLFADFQLGGTSVTNFGLTGSISSTINTAGVSAVWTVKNNSTSSTASTSAACVVANSTSSIYSEMLSTTYLGNYGGQAAANMGRTVCSGSSFTIGTGFGGSGNLRFVIADTFKAQLSATQFYVDSANFALGAGSADMFLTRKAAASIQHGAADAASPVAQTVGFQSVVAGTSNTAGANATFTGSIGTGTGAGGQLIFRTAPAGSTGTAQNALATGITITAPAVNMQPSVVVGNQALATTATDGFLYIPTCSGTPTGVPTSFTGRVALVYDTSANQFWIYSGGWLQPKTPAAAAIVTWQ